MLNKLLARRRFTGRSRSRGGLSRSRRTRGTEDPASHAYKGPTRRNGRCSDLPGISTSISPTGCTGARTSSAPRGHAQAVFSEPSRRSPGSTPHAVATGSADHGRQPPLGDRPRLRQALSITGDDDGADLVVRRQGACPAGRRVRCSGTSGDVRSGRDPPGYRGPWRWWVPGDPNVSKARLVGGSPRAAAT